MDTTPAFLNGDQRMMFGALNQALDGEPNLQSAELQYLNTNYLAANKQGYLGATVGISAADVAGDLLKELKAKANDNEFKRKLEILSQNAKVPGSFPDEQVLEAYRDVKKTIAKPILKIATKEGIKTAMKQHVKTAPFADITANSLSGPLSDYAANAITRGNVEKMFAESTVLRTAFKALGKKYPELAPENFRADNAEAQMALFIGRYTDDILHTIELMPKGQSAGASFVDATAVSPSSQTSINFRS